MPITGKSIFTPISTKFLMTHFVKLARKQNNFMDKKSLNKNLHKASEAKKDEFYTQLTDIEKELKHYKDQFRGKV